MDYKKLSRIADSKQEKSFEDIIKDVKRSAKKEKVEYVLETSTDKFIVDLDTGDNRANPFLIDLEEKYKDTGILKVSYKEYKDGKGNDRLKVTFKPKKTKVSDSNKIADAKSYEELVYSDNSDKPLKKALKDKSMQPLEVEFELPGTVKIISNGKEAFVYAEDLDDVFESEDFIPDDWEFVEQSSQDVENDYFWDLYKV